MILKSSIGQSGVRKMFGFLILPPSENGTYDLGADCYYERGVYDESEVSDEYE